MRKSVEGERFEMEVVRVQIRDERPEDHAAIYELTQVAFETMPFSSGDEQELVDALVGAAQAQGCAFVPSCIWTLRMESPNEHGGMVMFDDYDQVVYDPLEVVRYTKRDLGKAIALLRNSLVIDDDTLCDLAERIDRMWPNRVETEVMLVEAPKGQSLEEWQADMAELRRRAEEDGWEYLYEEAKIARKEAEIERKREEQG
jgi:hypothetical protein